MASAGEVHLVDLRDGDALGDVDGEIPDDTADGARGQAEDLDPHATAAVVHEFDGLAADDIDAGVERVADVDSREVHEADVGA